MLTKEEYIRIKKLDEDTDIDFGNLADNYPVEGELQDIDFFEDVDEKIYYKYEQSYNQECLINIIKESGNDFDDKDF